MDRRDLMKAMGVAAMIPMTAGQELLAEDAVTDECQVRGEALRSRAHPGEHVLDDVLGGRLISDQQGGQAHQVDVPGPEQVRYVRPATRRGHVRPEVRPRPGHPSRALPAEFLGSHGY